MQWIGYTEEREDGKRNRCMVTFDDDVDDAEKKKILDYLGNQLISEKQNS